MDLDLSVKDAWGLPVPRITFQLHPDDVKNAFGIQKRQAEILEAAGATQIWSYPPDDLGVSTHLMGTMRMGNDPARSVVNRFNRAHDVPNLSSSTVAVSSPARASSGRQRFKPLLIVLRKQPPARPRRAISNNLAPPVQSMDRLKTSPAGEFTEPE